MSGALAVVVLAGGEGRRLGGAKPLRTLAGERLIDRALRQARRWSDVVAVSVRSPTHLRLADVLLLPDQAGVAGPLGGLIASLKFAEASRCEFLLTIPADMPFLPANLAERLSTRIGEGRCALPASNGDLHQDCGLWRAAALPMVGDYVSSGRRSLIGFAELIGFEAVEWTAEPFDPFFNVNTADDLARAERVLSEIEDLDRLT